MRTVIDLSKHIHRRVALTVAIKVTSRLFAMPTDIHIASKQGDYTTILESLHPLDSGFEGTKNQPLVIGRYSVHLLVLHSRCMPEAGEIILRLWRQNPAKPEKA